jgi:cysteine desulfurase
MEENKDKRKIYLDYAATTPVSAEVFEVMKPYFCEEFGNASSAHSFGQRARQGVEKARLQVAEFLGCDAREIIFTSCATESNNLAIKGVIKKIRNDRGKDFLPHIITSAIEHHCVLHACEALEEDGFEVTYLPINNQGLVEINELEKAIKENTVLVSIMYANNEIGTVQPIEEIGNLIKGVNVKRKELNPSAGSGQVYFHVDAVQAINYLDCNVDKLNVDLLSLSAHKFYGPKGVGTLYERKGTPIARIQDGGEQEFKMRAGTHNTAGIVGLGAAIAAISNDQFLISNKIRRLRDELIKGVLEKIPNSKLNGSREKRLPNNANFSFPGAEGEAILLSLDLEGIAVSTGSACASENLNPSHVLMALGLGPEDAHASIRFTLGKYTTEEEIDYVLGILPKVIEKLRKISGNRGEAKKKLPDDFGC